ncbi:DUF885 domain-containing protein [Botrimarina mediterranea]|uniref:DUF885 domain-containing protein n=1 Tax=Botrimarina mediterranea TaxID=2528022 RepID=UPI001189E058|nr:hypothetical protein K2D_39040 [Planctomycetes bacterium K2D]
MIAPAPRSRTSRRLVALATLVSLTPLAIGPAAFAQAVAAPEAPAAQAPAAVETKTIAVAALTNYNQLIKEITFLGGLGGNPNAGDWVEGMIAFFTGGRGLEGLDKDRPIGVVVQTDGAGFAPIGCLPIADLTPVLELAENFALEPIDNGDGVYELELPEQTIYFQQVGEWTFVSNTPEALAQAPADPAKDLQKLVEKYDLGVTLYSQNLPAMYRQIALEQLRQGMEEGLVQQENETEEEFQARRALAETQIAQISDLIDGLNVVTIGWSIDAEKKHTFIDAELTALEGTDLALAMTTYENATSGVTGFHRPQAAASFLTSGVTPPELLEKQKAQNEAAIEMVRSQIDKALQEQIEEGKIPDDPDVQEAIKGATSDLVDVYADMIRNGRVEVGGSLDLAGEGFDAIAAGYVPDPTKVEAAFKKLAEAAAKEPKFPGVEWGYATHAGVTLHGMTVPVPEEAGQAREALGESVRLIMGVGGERVYFAMGPRGEESLKKAIDESAAKAGQPISPPGELIVSVGQILTAAEKVAPPNAAPMIGMILSGMEDVPAGADRLIVTSEPIDGGLRVRYLLEEGVLKAIGQAAATAAAMQQQGGAPGGF